jgi:hypothetical protein
MSPTCDCFFTPPPSTARLPCVMWFLTWFLNRSAFGVAVRKLSRCETPSRRVWRSEQEPKMEKPPAPQRRRGFGAGEPSTRLLEVKLPGHKFALREGKVEPTRMVGSSRFKPESVGSGRFTKVCIGARRASALSPSGQNLALGTRRNVTRRREAVAARRSDCGRTAVATWQSCAVSARFFPVLMQIRPLPRSIDRLVRFRRPSLIR